ncbi:MAG: ABC transporter ATP-binding protein [Candidatus Eremiobacteraeota bacterium]|nr:ABC transporter ATP-binding protein [Candidatus Eremiobacteraeota bacterium]
MLEVKSLTKRFGGLTAVNDVSFSLEAGAITAIIGPNGAGKSTCFNVISGFYAATSGRLFFEGADITALPLHAVARRGIARTFQTTALFANHSALDNAIAGYRQRTRSGFFDALLRTPRERREEREAREHAYEALRFAGIESSAARIAGSLSQEAQKRLAIAIAIVARPKLVLLDEPVAGVSGDQMAQHGELIARMSQAGFTVCLVEHKMDLVMGLADRIVVLHHGRKIAEGTPAEIRADDAVVEAYLGTAVA